MKPGHVAVVLAAAVAAGGLGLLAGSRWTAPQDSPAMTPRVAVGDLAPAITLPDLDDRPRALADFRGRQISWMLSESPLVDGNNVIVTPGGPGAGIVALDKMTGKNVWASQGLSDEAGYASPFVADVQGVRVVMTLTARGGVGVRASDGKLMWHHPAVANGTANVATPIFFDNKVFYSSAYGTGGALLGLTQRHGRAHRVEQAERDQHRRLPGPRRIEDKADHDRRRDRHPDGRRQSLPLCLGVARGAHGSSSALTRSRIRSLISRLSSTPSAP